MVNSESDTLVSLLCGFGDIISLLKSELQLLTWGSEYDTTKISLSIEIWQHCTLLVRPDTAHCVIRLFCYCKSTNDTSHDKHRNNSRRRRYRGYAVAASGLLDANSPQ